MGSVSILCNQGSTSKYVAYAGEKPCILWKIVSILCNQGSTSKFEFKLVRDLTEREPSQSFVIKVVLLNIDNLTAVDQDGVTSQSFVIKVVLLNISNIDDGYTIYSY